MTNAQTVVFGVLWTLVAGLAVLVLVLYRAVERAYKRDGVSASPGLQPGSAMPPLEVLRRSGVKHLAAQTNEVWLLLFVSSTCDTCRSLLREGLANPLSNLPVTVVVTQGEQFDQIAEFSKRRQGTVVEYLVNPADAWHQAGVEQVPFAYVLRGTTILAGAVIASLSSVDRLVDLADRFERDTAHQLENTSADRGGDLDGELV